MTATRSFRAHGTRTGPNNKERSPPRQPKRLRGRVAHDDPSICILLMSGRPHAALFLGVGTSFNSAARCTP